MRGRCVAGAEKYAGLLSVNLDWDRLQALLSSIETRLEGAATKDSVNAVRASHADFRPDLRPASNLCGRVTVSCMGGDGSDLYGRLVVLVVCVEGWQ